MTRRDDMVFRPDLGDGANSNARSRSRVDRRMAGARKPGSTLIRIAKIRQRRRLVRRMQRRKSSINRLGFARQAGGMVARAGRFARFANPVGMLIVAGVVAATVAVRLGTGKPFEGIGKHLNKMFLGDLDEKARAKMALRGRLKGDEDLSFIASRTAEKGKLSNSQISRLADDLYKLELRNQVGKNAIEEMLPVNSTLDMIIIAARDKFVSLWKAGEGPSNVEKMKKGYWKVLLSPTGPGGSVR